MKIFQNIMTLIYLLMGIIVLMIAEYLATSDAWFIPYLVFAVIMLYGSMNLVVVARAEAERNKMKNYIHGASAIFIAVIVLITSFVSDNTIYISCVVWAVWSIFKEGHTFQNEIFGKIMNKTMLILNIVLSVAVCIFSALMIIDPLKHIHTHVVLLGIEWILEAVNAFVFAITKKKMNVREQGKK